jgi:endonuclease/exonuclease/phosphatase (EEP) superfamily protein YafD
VFATLNSATNMQFYVRLVINSAAICAGIATLFALLPDDIGWGFDLLSHPRPQYSLALCFALILAGFDKAWLKISLLLLPLSINAYYLLPWYFPTPSVFDINSIPISITHVNVDKNVKKHTALWTDLNTSQTQIIFLQEVTPHLASRLPLVLPDYQIILSHPLNNTHGSAVLLHKNAKLAIFSKRIIYLPKYSIRPLLEIGIKVNNEKVWLLSLHTTRVRNKHTLEGQKVEFQAVAAWSATHLSSIHQHTLIIGDFNLTPWSTRFQNLMYYGQLEASKKARNFTTWPAFLPSFMRIPIDHALFSQNIDIIKQSTGTAFGGDHLALRIHFFVKIDLLQNLEAKL